MKNLKFKRNMWMIIGATIIASIQSGIIIFKGGMDTFNFISFTFLQYLYMNSVSNIFENKEKELSGK